MLRHSLPPADAVQLERLTDPMTGWLAVGAGAAWPCEHPTSDLIAEILLDGQLLVDAPVERTASGYRFGLHAPLDPTARTMQVRLCQPDSLECHLIAERLLVEVGFSASRIPLPPRSRWLSPFRTLGRSLIRGQCFLPSWWHARYQRYRHLALQVIQRLRDKRRLRRPEFRTLSVHDAYCERTNYPKELIQDFQRRQQTWKYQPIISIIVPVYNTPAVWLREAIQSVQAQLYPHWQLCLADDASTKSETLEVLKNLPPDERIQWVRRESNGHICACMNTAADLASGEFVAFLDHDDKLAPQALFRVVERLQAEPHLDLIYSDEDKIDQAGHRYDPQFKPDWSPELLLSYNYINHLTIVRRKLFERLGRFRLGLEGAQDYDLLLRLTQQTDSVGHIPEILYHWRSHPGSTASTATQKPIVQSSAEKALAEAVQRRRLGVQIIQPLFAQQLRLPICQLVEAKSQPSVAVVVYGSSDQAAETLRAVKASTNYAHFNSYLVLEQTDIAASLNRLAAARTEDYLLFLQAGLTPTEPSWLAHLLAYAIIPGVGAVGALLRDADGRIISAGTILGMGEDGLPADAFRGERPEPVSYYFYAESTRNVSAPAPGCLLTARRIFEQLGGLDDRHYPNTLWDVDYSLRLAGQGLRAVQVGGVELLGTLLDHGRFDAPTELRTLLQAYGRREDPFHNPNLDRWRPFHPRSEAPHLAKVPPLKSCRVLFGTHNLYMFEGIPKILFDFATRLQRRGEASACFVAPQPGPGQEILKTEGIPSWCERQPFSPRWTDGQWTPAEYERAVRYVQRIIRQSSAELVFAGTLGLFPLVEAASRCGIPAILAIQESYTAELLRHLFSPYAVSRIERALHFAQRVIFPSRSCAELYERLNSRKNFEIIHNGLDCYKIEEFLRSTSRVDAERELQLPTDNWLRFVTVGTVCERKGQHHLVEAAAVLKRSRHDFRCYLVGAREGLPYLNFIRHLIRRHDLDEQVVLVPETPKVWSYLRASDAYVCCSYLEGHSLSILESQAFGLPLISTPCGGVEEQAVWGRSALRFDFGDARQLACQMQKLLLDPTSREQLRREARANFELHPDADGIVERLAELLRRVMSARGPRRHPTVIA